jgi:peptidoglycan/xylan/chitin deacetylase (PgdA/CDA1 family)
MFHKISQLFGNFKTHNGIIVLMYHRVNDKLPAGPLNVPPDIFYKQMLFLKLYSFRFQVISLDEMLAWFREPDRPCGSKKPKTKVLITFDDGYRDNHTCALPVLKQFAFPAVVFLTTDYIGTNHKRPRYSDVPWERDYLNTDEIMEMKGCGISFGAHTATHAHLDAIAPENANDEILRSCEYLRTVTAGASPAFCYPYGDYNAQVIQLVREAGCSCAFTVKQGINYRAQDIFELKRIDIHGTDGISSFKYKVTEKYK